MAPSESTPRRGKARFAVAAIALVTLLTGWKPESAHDRAVELLARLSAPATSQPASSSIVSIPSNHGAVRARLYEAPEPLGRALVLAHGVHRRGIEEPRFVRFCVELARLGFSVLSPELTALSEYRLRESSVDTIAASIDYLSARRDLAPRGRVGLIGISFGGGLSLVAAERPNVSQKLEYVTSVGGHHDLERVLRFFLTNRIQTPKGERTLDAHEYGLALLVLDHLDTLAPESDRAALTQAFRAHIAEDRAQARTVAKSLRTEPARDLFDKLVNHHLAELAPVLLPRLEQRRESLERLSPKGRLARIPVPVYLLHGASDRVIPASELTWADQELGQLPHVALVTSLIEHVNLDRPASVFEKLALVEFMANML